MTISIDTSTQKLQRCIELMRMYFCLACLLLWLLCVTYLTVIVVRSTFHLKTSDLSRHDCNKSATAKLEGGNQGKVTKAVFSNTLIGLSTSDLILLCVACLNPLLSFILLSDLVLPDSQCYLKRISQSYHVGIVAISKIFKERVILFVLCYSR